MFITPAYAQTAGGAGGGILELLFPLILVGGIMWFLVIRPQRQQQKARTEMLSNVRRNDTVVTGGGLVGKVTKVIDDAEVEVQIAPDVKVRALRSMLADVRVKGDAPKNDNAKPAKSTKTKPAAKSTTKAAKAAKADKADDKK
ncbi:MAG: preprotein translocase subunit YajC [Rhizobiaceae bacterium]|nr:preprotein translocase subunit YajC [Rhizobiaceae bacterium]